MVRENTITRRKPNSRRRKHNVAAIIICIFLVLIIAAGIIIFLNRDVIFRPNGNNENSSTENSTSNSQTESGKNQKDETKNDDKKDSETREKEKPSVAQYSGEDPNRLDTITGTISSTDISSGVLTVRVMLDQSLGSSGTCNFTLAHTSGKTVTGSANTEANPSATFCIYSASASNINSGHWQITVKVETTDKKGTITGEADF